MIRYEIHLLCDVSSSWIKRIYLRELCARKGMGGARKGILLTWGPHRECIHFIDPKVGSHILELCSWSKAWLEHTVHACEPYVEDCPLRYNVTLVNGSYPLTIGLHLVLFA